MILRLNVKFLYNECPSNHHKDVVKKVDTSKFALLKTKYLNCGAPFVHTKQESKPALLDDPAEVVLSDFTINPPYTTTESVALQNALQQMKILKVRSLFVVDKDDRVLGHVSARDIQGTKPSMIADQLGIKPSEVTVKMLMLSCKEMPTIQFNELSNARVGHIARLFHALGVNYIFVIEHDDAGQECIRGIFSISRLSNQLGENMMGDLSSHTVAEMNQQL